MVFASLKTTAGVLEFDLGLWGRPTAVFGRLEGPPGAVEAVFERTQQDPRHADVSVIDASRIDERRFANWAMAFVGAEGDAAARHARISTDSGFDLGQVSGDEVTEALVRLRLEDERVWGQARVALFLS